MFNRPDIERSYGNLLSCNLPPECAWPTADSMNNAAGVGGNRESRAGMSNRTTMRRQRRWLFSDYAIITRCPGWLLDANRRRRSRGLSASSDAAGRLQRHRAADVRASWWPVMF